MSDAVRTRFLGFPDRCGGLLSPNCLGGLLFTGAIGRHARQRLGSFRDDLGAFALSMPLDVKVKHTKDGKVSGYELSRPARIGVQSEFANYLDGGPWEQTRMQLVRSLGGKEPRIRHS